MKNLLLVQPHSDDILFSASKFLFQRKKYDKVVLLTIENNNEKRTLEDIELCEMFNMTYDTLNFPVEDGSYGVYYKELKFKEFGKEQAYECLKKKQGSENLKKISKKLVKKVEKYKAQNFEVVNCLGVGHPFHLFISDVLKEQTDIFYRDFPHSQKRKAQKFLKERLQHFKEIEEHYPGKLHGLKWELAYDIYKTQRSVLFFEQGYLKKKLPEVYYEKA